MTIIDGDLSANADLNKNVGHWIALYTCFEIVDYREEISGRSVSIQELQMKSQNSKSEYEQYREMKRKEFYEEQG